jgi:CCR4-NOT transcriptional regulation complex NOT5 subunit
MKNSLFNEIYSLADQLETEINDKIEALYYKIEQYEDVFNEISNELDNEDIDDIIDNIKYIINELKIKEN